jgi:hypothetical protein
MARACFAPKPRKEEFPLEVIGALLFYATEDSDFLTGQSMNVDGGKYCQ